MQPYKWLLNKNKLFYLYQSPYKQGIFQSNGFSTIVDVENILYCILNMFSFGKAVSF